MSADFLRIFEAKALAEELTKAGHSVSERTAQRWKAGVTKPKPQDIRAIQELVGQSETSPPAWAEGLAKIAAENAITRLVPPELLEQVPEFFGRIEAFLRQAAEDAHEEPGSQGPAGSAPQGRTDE